MKNVNEDDTTRLQLLLAMARNLSIVTRGQKDSEGEKGPKKGKKMSKNVQKSATICTRQES